MSKRVVDAVRPVWQSARSYIQKKFFVGNEHEPYLPPKDSFRKWPGESNAKAHIPEVPPGQEYDIHKRHVKPQEDEDPVPLKGMWPNHVPMANWERDEETLDWLLRQTLTTGVLHFGKNVIRPGDYINMSDEKARDYMKVDMPMAMAPLRPTASSDPLPMNVRIRIEQENKVNQQNMEKVHDILQTKQQQQQQQQQQH